jgi:hypothetical protein
VTWSASSLWIGYVAWNGAYALFKVAPVDETTGVWGSWSALVTIGANLPSSSSRLAPTTNWFVVGTPAVHPAIDVGGVQVVPWVL